MSYLRKHGTRPAPWLPLASRPADPRMLDVVGFDTATPQLISDFARDAL
jgi:hypothetical protein